MVLDKLREALAEVEIERKRIDGVEAGLKSIIAQLCGEEVVVSPVRPARAESDSGEEKTYIDSVADILREAGQSLHISQIVPRLCDRRGLTIKRGTIEPSMNRHIAKAKAPKIYKAGPSTYGLPEWKQHSLQPTLVQIA